MVPALPVQFLSLYCKSCLHPAEMKELSSAPNKTLLRDTNTSNPYRVPCNTIWPPTSYVEEEDLKLPASSLQVLGLPACATILGFKQYEG